MNKKLVFVAPQLGMGSGRGSRIFSKTGWLGARIIQVEMNREGRGKNKSLLKGTIKILVSLQMLHYLVKVGIVSVAN